MTNREIVASVRTQLKQITGDNTLSDRAILADLRSTASLLIKRETDKRRLFTVDSLFTTLNCVEMIEVPLAECCSYTSPCTIRRSKYKMPKVGEGIWGYIIQGVWSVDGSKSFSKGTAKRYANAKDLGLNTDPNLYWLQNGYLYVSNSDIELIKVKAFFEEEPTKDLNACDSNDEESPCENPLDKEFKCPGYLIQGVLDIVNQKYASLYLRVQEDLTDNDTEKPN